MSDGADGDEQVDEIHRLDEATIERIAAGEVVERPASAVKELVENSLDADASRVRVVVEAGGTDGIRVTDDGRGMSAEAVERAVEKHTTSKIADIDDLEAGVGSLGFRGEALAAIGAVSRLTIRTKPRGANRGTELRMAGGEIESVKPAGCPEGTTVEVDDLFYNVPARRKYLKQDATEFTHVNRVATGYALSNPEVALALEHDGREVFSTTGQGSLEATVLAVYGRDVATAMLPIGARAESGADDADEAAIEAGGPLDELSGIVSHPETTRASPEYCSVFVNGRYVSATAVRDAIVAAYGSQLAPDRYPFAVLFLSLPADQIDVNVHPRKREVRFADEAGVRDQVRTAVESALMREGVVRSGAPRGRSAPDQTEIEPESGDAGSADDGGASARPDRSTDADEPASRPAEPSDATDTTRADPDDSGTETTGTGSTDAEPEQPPASGSHTAISSEPTEVENGATTSDQTTRTADDAPHEPNGEPSAADDNDRQRAPADAGKFTDTAEQTTLAGDRVPDDHAFDRLPRLRVLGQLHDTYIICESSDGLVLIDQHAADERVNYERLRERTADGTTVQQLADPVEIELTAAETELFETFADALAELGFEASRADDRSIVIHAVPAVLDGAADPDRLRDVLSGFVGDGEPGESIERDADALLADLACYPSITGNTSLAEGSVIDLLRTLDDCENPYACPHGRPVVIEVGSDELDDRFERDYPGHAGRRE
ncbi:DNA mismatch repair endonuclease MutL [Halococcus saccharolyticus]|uniref:DNA mismatch repair protein MutL n=1 Tax=Halococcus saccharolyticus DSM 5350 TaxID=1227455 RepID=M0MF83_9EURY|nr:DNA mismatch repair endonuclease MutL [Halococcus saccharolyticus]EMA43354.1 DNA mismatch repair protein MutL [Halococcus saccharolyticus DSM 5350]